MPPALGLCAPASAPNEMCWYPPPRMRREPLPCDDPRRTFPGAATACPALLPVPAVLPSAAVVFPPVDPCVAPFAKASLAGPGRFAGCGVGEPPCAA